MRCSTKFLGVAALTLAAVIVVAGCGSSGGGSGSSGASSSPNAKVYHIGVTQIVTHPALDGAIAGFKQALAA